ncbi:MAG: hypothetical protein AB9834_18025 [Lentimicrobium sp.]
MKIRYVAIFLILVIPALISESIAQEVTKSKPVFGVRLSANFDNIFFSDYYMDYWVLRSIPGIFLEYKNHDFQIGPAHAHFINNPGWLSSIKFNSNALGFSFGYRYYPNEILKRMRMFAQLQATQFWVKYTSHSMGSGISDRKETAWYGFASLGVDYRISKSFHVFSGVGIGISSTFHNYTENFYPHVLAGIDFRFGTPKKVPESRAQKIIKSKPVFGFRYTANYASIPTGQSYSKNFRVLSSIPSVFVEYNKLFDFHIGIVYAHLLNPHWFGYKSFEQDAFGLYLGCRLTTREHFRNLRLIGQIDLSATKVGFKQTNSHFQHSMVKKILWVPALSMGGDYQLNNNFHITTGCSAGLAIGEYYNLNKMILSLFLGFDYRFGNNKKEKS